MKSFWLSIVLCFVGQFRLSVSLNDSSKNSNTDNSLSFILLGDWGKGGSTGKYGSSLSHSGELNGIQLHAKSRVYQMEVARAMRAFASNQSREVRPSFVVALGDNFYANGVSSATDILWSNLWKDVYVADYPELNIPWYPVFGNHDYGGSTSAQIQRYLDHTDDDIWMFESPCYAKTFPIRSSSGEIGTSNDSISGTVVIIFIDTTTLAPSENNCCNEKGGVSLELQHSRIHEQLRRIEYFLNESISSDIGRPSWLFVAGHYPVFSAGSNGDTQELQTYLQPLLERYRVDAYFSGHDHMSEHLRNNGVDYFVAGAGSMTDTVRRTSSGGPVLWAGEGYAAFAVVNATADWYSVDFIDTANEKRYSVRINSMAANKRPSNAPVIRPSIQPSSAPSLFPSAKPSQAPTSFLEGSNDMSNAPSDQRSFLSTIERFFTDSSRSPTVFAVGSVFGASLLLLLVYMMYNRNGKRQSKADTKRSLYQVVSIPPVDNKDARMMRRDRTTSGFENEDGDEAEVDGRDEEEGGSGCTGTKSPLYSSLNRMDVDHPLPLTDKFRGWRSASTTLLKSGSDGESEFYERNRLHTSLAGNSSGQASSNANSSPSDLTQSDGDGVPSQLRLFESELRLKLFDVIAHSITSEEIRSGTTDGRVFQQGGRVVSGVAAAAYASSPSSHRRAVTMEV